MKKKIATKILSVILAFALVFGVMPAFHADASTSENQTADVKEYTVNLKGNSSTRFLYNADKTDKGVVITYTVKKATGTPVQNGVVQSSAPNQSYPFGNGVNTTGQLRYNNTAAPNMLEEGATYKCSIYQTGNNVDYTFEAITADGQKFEVNIVWPPNGTLYTDSTAMAFAWTGTCQLLAAHDGRFLHRGNRAQRYGHSGRMCQYR